MQNDTSIQSSMSAESQPAPHDEAAAASPILTPGVLHVKKRDNRSVVPFDASKIALAIRKAFLDEEGGSAADSRRVHEIVEQLTTEITDVLKKRAQTQGQLVHVEEIQDQVVASLMRNQHYQVGIDYMRYREQRHQARLEAQKTAVQSDEKPLNVTLDDGRQMPLDIDQLRAILSEACADLSEVSSEKILADSLKNLFDGVKYSDVRNVLIMTARTFIEQEPQYSYVAARLLLLNLQEEALKFLVLPNRDTLAGLRQIYSTAFLSYVDRGIEAELLDPMLKQTFDLDALAQALKPERDFQFNYLSLQTLYDRYFLHVRQTRFELPQAFFMRVAMGLASQEADPNARAIEFYNLISQFDYMSSTPTLFNSATLRPQLSSCYLTHVPDHLDGIYNALKDNALLSKFAGGLGNDWTSVRAMGALIKGTNGQSQGVVPFLKVANDTAVAVNQGGKRKGAVCAYLETWHLDIEEFLDLRKNTGDDRRRTHDMNTANWIPDLFMKRVHRNEDWTLFSPDDVPDLHDRYGLDFENAYEAYEAKAQAGEIENFKTIPAVKLWRKMLSLLFETGHPWLTFKDPCNLRSPQQHVGVVHSSNLCTEITLNTSVDEIAVCNLGSINLVQHLKDGQLDTEKLKQTVTTAVRMLDNVIDINYYSVIQARRSNLKHRPVGLGLMGFQDALYQLDIPYASQEAVAFADRSMELISYYAIEASADLAKERGAYASYEGSLWSKGILPIDSVKLLADARGDRAFFEQDTSTTLDWDSLRQKVKTQGMRNSNVMAIAPTATISNICGVSQSIEPTFQNLYVKSNLSGEFTVVNPHLVADLKALKLWDQVLINDLKYFDGSIQKIDRIPDHLKAKYANAFEIDPQWLIEAASRRQKWIDQSQSLNLYLGNPSGKRLDSMYRLAWLRGLKTCYYLRTLGASDTEKSTLNRSSLNAVASSQPKACSIDNPDCEACQ